jgi:lysophospholipase L1-like esterase
MTGKHMGYVLILAGLLANQIVFNKLFSADGNIQSNTVIWAIYTFQFALISSGLYLLIKRPKLRFEKKSLALAFCSFVFSIGLLELGSRIWLKHFADEASYQRYQFVGQVMSSNLKWSPHHYLNHYPTPNYRKGSTSHNSLGFRGKEISPTKGPDTYRIVAIGGSTTYTSAVEDDEKTFTAQLNKILAEDFAYRNVEVINAGVVAYNSWESLINFQFRVLDLDPDLVIVYFGTNDVHARLVEPSTYSSDNSGTRKQWRLPRLNFVVRYSALAHIISDRLDLGDHAVGGLEPLIFADSFRGAVSGFDEDSGQWQELLNANAPVHFERNLRSLSGVARAHDVDVLMATWAHSPEFSGYSSTASYQRGFREMNDVTRKVAREEDVYFFDFAAAMPGDEEYWDDGRHVNELGALKKAELFAEFIDRNKIID